MNDIADLYQELIIDHSVGREISRCSIAAQSAEGYNPLCGDRLTVYVRMDGDVIADASFSRRGLRHFQSVGLADDGEHQGRRREEGGENIFGISMISLLVLVIPISRVSGSWRHFPVCVNFP